MPDDRENQLKKIDFVTNDILKESKLFNDTYTKISENANLAIEDINNAIKRLEIAGKEVKDLISETRETLQEIKAFQSKYSDQIISDGDQFSEYISDFDDKAMTFLKDKVVNEVYATLEDLTNSANQDFKEIRKKLERIEKTLIKNSKK